MESGNYTLHRRALMALHQLPEAEKIQVLDCVATLSETPLQDWAGSGVRRLRGEPSLYLVTVNDSLRLIVRRSEGQRPEVQDIVRQETLEMFARLKR